MNSPVSFSTGCPDDTPFADRVVRCGYLQFCAEAAVQDLIEAVRASPSLFDPAALAELADSLAQVAMHRPAR